jgi:hypothetical protein
MPPVTAPVPGERSSGGCGPVAEAWPDPQQAGRELVQLLDAVDVLALGVPLLVLMSLDLLGAGVGRLERGHADHLRARRRPRPGSRP